MRGAPRAALALGAAAALAACGPRATVRPGGADRPTTFRYAGAADAVTVSGDMTGWSPVALAPAGGAWEVALPVPPGRYEFRLEVRRAGRIEPVVPDGAERTRDGFGGENGVLRVGP